MIADGTRVSPADDGQDASRTVVGSARPSDPPTDLPADEQGHHTAPASGSASTERVMRGALALFSIQPLTWTTSFLLIIYAPQFLGSAAMGQWAMLTALAGVTSTIFGLGVPTVLVRRVAAEPDNVPQSAAAAMVTVTFASVLGCGTLALALHATGLLDLPPVALAVTLATVVISLSQTVVSSILNGQHRLGQFAWISAANVVGSALGIIAVLFAGGGLVGMMVVVMVITLVVTLLGWRAASISFDWSSINWSALRSIVIAGLPFAGMSLVLRLRGDSEVMLLGVGLSVDVLGWWNAAERISYIAIFVPTLMVTPLMPALTSVAENAAAFRSTLRRTLDLTVVLTLGASCGVLAIAPAIPTAFGWGADFIAAIPLIEILSMVTPIVSFSMILGTALIALGRERRWFVISVVMSSLHLIVTPTAIFTFNYFFESGGIGAALAKVLIETLMIVSALYLLPRGAVTRSSWVVVVKALIASGVMIAVVRIVLTWESSFALPAGIACGGIVYLATLAALRIMPPSELADVREFLTTIVRRRSG